MEKEEIAFILLLGVVLVNIFIIKKQYKIMASQSELAAQLNEVATQLQKIGTESAATLQKVSDLEAALENADNVSPELQAAFEAVKAQVIKVDELVPDAPAPTPEV